MSWLYVPGLAGSNSALDSQSAQRLASSVTSKGKHMQPRYWLRAWQTGAWVTRLSGVTYEPSTLDRGVASWISSLEVTHASPSVARASNSASVTRGTCGPTSLESSTSASPRSSSAKTSAHIFVTASTSSPATWKRWATELRRHCTQRSSTAHGTSASGYSGQLLATPTTKDNMLSPSMRKQPAYRAVQTLPTPTAGDANSTRNATARGHWDRTRAHKGVTLTDAVTLWPERGMLPTPTARDYKDSGPNVNYEKIRNKSKLAGFAGGSLNPTWVEWLMGWPIGWTDCEHAAMASYLSWLRMHS